MKTLVTCKPTEFLVQTNKIRKYAEKWLKDTQILEIRKNVPELKSAPHGATPEEKRRVVEENKALLQEQSSKNLKKMLDAIMDEYPEETLRLLALCCFIEPNEIDDHTVEEYLDALAGLIGNASVISFFTSLVLLGQTLGSDVPKE